VDLVKFIALHVNGIVPVPLPVNVPVIVVVVVVVVDVDVVVVSFVATVCMRLYQVE
jgi:hypothetical protein